MIDSWNPKILLLIAFGLLLLGFALPALMIMQMLPSTFFLNFLAYGASFTGLMLGFLGAILIASRGRRR
jgi:hypothetical protein